MTNCHESISWLVLMASGFSIKILSMRSLFGIDTEKKTWWKGRMCATWKFELKKHLCEKRGQLLKKISKNIKISKYQNIKIANSSNLRNWTWTCLVTDWFEKIMDVSNFVFHFQFDILCRSRFKFLIGNFTVVLIRNFFPDWEPKF